MGTWPMGVRAVVTSTSLEEAEAEESSWEMDRVVANVEIQGHR
jgi:hypothetical protein